MCNIEIVSTKSLISTLLKGRIHQKKKNVDMHQTSWCKMSEEMKAKSNRKLNYISWLLFMEPFETRKTCKFRV